MASYHVADANIAFEGSSRTKIGGGGRPRNFRTLSSLSFISERLEILRINSDDYDPAVDSSVHRGHCKSRKNRRKKSRSGCTKNCFLLRCFEFLGSPAQESIYDADGDEIECGPIRYVPHSLAALTQTTKFTKEELKTMYRTFKNECPTGVVYEETFKSIYSQFFPSGDANMYAHYLFNAFDNNQEGYICFEDFVTSLSSLLRGKFEDKLQWTFKLYDINHDGFITKEEMQDIVKSVYSLLGSRDDPGHSEYSYIEHANRVFHKLDRNGDGYVTYSEFLEACKDDESIVASMKVFDAKI